MSGPEHYREAERLLTKSDNAISEVADFYAMQARVHATLALAAATIDGAAHPNQSQVDFLGQWFEVQR